jgi:hypothetical protein
MAPTLSAPCGEGHRRTGGTYHVAVFTGSELVIVVVLFAIGIGLVVLAARSQPRPAGSPINTVEVPAAAHPWLIAVVGDLANLPKHSVDWLSHDVAIVTWTRRSGWVFVVAVFLFPLGLAALLFTMTEHGTIAVVDGGAPGRLSFGGQFSNAAVDVVNGHLPG